ncbi:hypothetical protein GLOIN_2v1775636 [Rhizophagus irregularis DAOM 181602=DAOM 197198]|uniref:Uncharacterized protein n=1 Tax=Rhizophagus irregularis (strain DAOM 181602 / DAOM 197198 / MUCL 43194) TaxID=747089 RepID=A0A2P4PZ24_RHIID|nr:hypothetical protein GLOIN_2v1775636 [Rhizophagus irregularis DAOM 181602=DAOM 197198]POG70629.1 hypothetical protein GLOIN_2v1775636 [Rhizophagus irregularis DAOM 181602=DAOM 197198]|eukprot:XP_025177495.1 hypothetical protein GLOIN_2v1775636 [Rhizophagus irregularis DAOM 181602=DAOM 197198]
MKDGTFGTRKIQRTKQNNKVVVNNPSEDEQFCEVTGFPELNSSFTHPVPKNRLILKKIQHLPRKLFSHLHPPLSPKHKLAKNVRKTVGRRQQLKIAHRKEERRLQQELIEKENHDPQKATQHTQQMNNDTPQHTPSVKDVDKNIINDPGPSTSTLTTSSSTSSISTSPTTPQILFPQKDAKFLSRNNIFIKCSLPPTNDSDNESTNNHKRSKARINDETDTPTSGSKRQYLQTAGWSHATHGIRFQLLECLVLLL